MSKSKAQIPGTPIKHQPNEGDLSQPTDIISPLRADTSIPDAAEAMIDT